MKVRYFYCCAFLLILLPNASAYTFQESPAVPDSVRLTLNPQESVNGTVALDVLAYQVSDIYAAAFDLDFNPSVIEWAGKFSHDPDGYKRGTFFGTQGMYEIANQIEANGTKNKGKLVAGVLGSPSYPKSGSGSIMTIKFRVVGSGTTTISFSNSNLIKPDMSFTSTSWYGGTFISDGATPSSQQDDPPVVYLNTPDGSVFSSGNISLFCTASDDYGLINITLYTNITGSWQPYQTKTPGNNVWTESFSLSNLQNGNYKWNCKAVDSSGQERWGQVENTFRVQLPSDFQPPVRSNGQPSGSIVETNVTISIQTNEVANCKYSNIPEMGYESMIYNFNTSDGTTHSANLNLIDNHSYRFYVRCNDSSGNANTDDFLISFTIGTVQQDNQPPIITSNMATGLFSWNTKYVTLAVNTDEDAICRYAHQGGMIFGSMATFSNTFFKNHSTILAAFQEGKQYDYYVKCSDNYGNTNPSDTLVSFYVCYEVDSDCSRSISINELNAYINRWHYDSSDVTLARLIRAISLWKHGVA